VKELWKKYRVKSIKDGNVTLITLDSKTGMGLSEEEEAMLEKIAQAVNEYFKENYVDNGEVGILWAVSTHQSIIYSSCVKYGELDYCRVAKEHADDPDSWAQVPPPPGYPDWMWNFIMQLVWSWTHYYNPDWGTGSAPSEAKYYADESKNYYMNGNKYLAYQYLGYASHFVTDVGNPLHTGAEARQVLLSALLGDIKYITLRI
jgi:hypothetical protein